MRHDPLPLLRYVEKHGYIDVDLIPDELHLYTPKDIQQSHFLQSSGPQSTQYHLSAEGRSFLHSGMETLAETRKVCRMTRWLLVVGVATLVVTTLTFLATCLGA